MEVTHPSRVGGVCPRSSAIGCTVMNKSNSECQVQIRYEADKPYESVVNILHLKPEQQQHSGIQEFLSDEGIGRRKEINSIKVTRSDGRTDELHAPFEHSIGVQIFLFFTIDDEQIKSVKSFNQDDPVFE